MEVVHREGGHLRKIDFTLPASYLHQKAVWESGAYLMTQLRTGYTWLSTYAKAFGFRDDDQCACGAQEIVTHVLVDCLRLKKLRRKLWNEVGDAFNSVSSLLGGSLNERGKLDNVSRARTVKAVLDFAEAHNGFEVARHDMNSSSTHPSTYVPDLFCAQPCSGLCSISGLHFFPLKFCGVPGY